MNGAATHAMLSRLTRRPGLGIGMLVALCLLGLATYKGWLFARARFIEPRSHWRTAQEAIDRRDFSAALPHLELCANAWPDDVETRFLLARTQRRAGKLDEAKKSLVDCEHLAEQKGDATRPDTKLEWALLRAQHNNLPEVEKYLQARLREFHPDSLLILETLSWQLMWTGRLADARGYLDIWLKERPNEHDALVRRGWVFEHLLNRPAAIDDYEAALAVQPDDDNVRLRLVELFLNENRPADALGYLQPLMETRSGDSDVVVCMARCQRISGQFGPAEKTLNKLLAEHPQNAQALSELGMLALEKGQTAEAERLLRQAAAKEPHNRLIIYSLWQCLEKLGERDEAKQIKDSLARNDAATKRMDQLIRDVMKRPYDPSLRHEIGTIFLQNGFTEDGLRWLVTALNVDPSHRPTHQALAEYYERTGKPEEAARHRRFLQ
jgi:predicted Zn-dependent protease